jgi:hypothetical protein
MHKPVLDRVRHSVHSRDFVAIAFESRRSVEAIILEILKQLGSRGLVLNQNVLCLVEFRQTNNYSVNGFQTVRLPRR